MDKLHLLSVLKEYARKFPHRFHMPGHKGDARFTRLFKGARLDITELYFSDNLQDPTGVIRLAENDVAARLGAQRSFFLTDGSTCGIYAMLFAVAHKGKKIIVNRNAHKSVFNACEVMKIEPVVLNQNVIEGVMVPPSADDVEKTLEEHPDAIGVLLTYPDYYGVAFDLKKVAEAVKRAKKVLLIDGAHGGHFRYDRNCVYAGEYADLWVDGVHKTMPALTQAAILNVGNTAYLEDAEDSVNRFRTTSPSYPIMASAEYAEKYMNESGREAFMKLREELILMKQRLSNAGYKFLQNDDPLKLVVDFKSVNISPYRAEDYLKWHDIFIEMNDGQYLVFMLSPYYNVKELHVLEGALSRIAKKRSLKDTYRARAFASSGKRKIPYLQAVKRGRSERVPLEQAVGRVAAANAGSFPPCVPTVIAGEEITEEMISFLKYASGAFGVADGKIKVVKEKNEG